jgi:hypothetical protein
MNQEQMIKQVSAAQQTVGRLQKELAEVRRAITAKLEATIPTESDIFWDINCRCGGMKRPEEPKQGYVVGNICYTENDWGLPISTFVSYDWKPRSELKDTDKVLVLKEGE